MEKFILLCKVLAVSPSYLLGESEVMDDLDGLELVKFVRLKTPEVEEAMKGKVQREKADKTLQNTDIDI